MLIITILIAIILFLTFSSILFKKRRNLADFQISQKSKTYLVLSLILIYGSSFYIHTQFQEQKNETRREVTDNKPPKIQKTKLYNVTYSKNGENSYTLQSVNNHQSTTTTLIDHKKPNVDITNSITIFTDAKSGNDYAALSAKAMYNYSESQKYKPSHIVITILTLGALLSKSILNVICYITILIGFLLLVTTGIAIIAESIEASYATRLRNFAAWKNYHIAKLDTKNNITKFDTPTDIAYLNYPSERLIIKSNVTELYNIVVLTDEFLIKNPD